MSLIQHLRRRAGTLVLFAALFAAAGCATDSPIPTCVNCGQWTELMTGLGRFPEPHPANPDILLFSTIDKSPAATDADRQSDEDIWLVYRNPSDPSTETLWQLTDDALGAGDNFGARWSPSGTQIAFVHVTAAGRFEIWRMSVTVPSSPTGIPVLGTPELLLQTARDPAWESETSVVFTRDNKIYRVAVPASPGPVTGAPVQLTFDPPIFASTENYVDRQPMIASDGGAVFNTIGRQNVADVYLRAFEIDGSVFPPDTTETAAWISYKAPTSDNPAYPLFIGLDTLRTPELLPSLPVGTGGTFPIGVRRDSRYITDPRVESYCDTTLIINAELQPGDVDTLSYYFTVIRGTLSIQSGISQTEVFWTRQDAEQDINDFTNNTLLANIGERLDFECLMPFSFLPNGEADVSRREMFLVIGSRGSLRDTALVTVPSGGIQSVRLFPTGTISGNVSFSDSPTVRPPVLARVLLAGTAEVVASAAGDSLSAFAVKDVPEATYDVVISAAGYQSVTVTGVVATPPGDTALGTVTLNPVPGAGLSPVTVADVAPPHAGRSRSTRVTSVRPPLPADNGAALSSIFRGPGDVTTVWQLDLASQPVGLREILGSAFLIQNPAVTNEFPGGVRYVAYISNEGGDWELYIQRLVNWQTDGPPTLVATPGTTDNLNCRREVFHPRWVPGTTSGPAELLVSMSDCPNNGFEGIGFDDDPWAVGEIRLWKLDVTLAP